MIDIYAFTLLELLSPYKISGNEFLSTECTYILLVWFVSKEEKATTIFFWSLRADVAEGRESYCSCCNESSL